MNLQPACISTDVYLVLQPAADKSLLQRCISSCPTSKWPNFESLFLRAVNPSVTLTPSSSARIPLLCVAAAPSDSSFKSMRSSMSWICFNVHQYKTSSNPLVLLSLCTAWNALNLSSSSSLASVLWLPLSSSCEVADNLHHWHRRFRGLRRRDPGSDATADRRAQGGVTSRRT